MADANEKIVRKREREPITLVCFVVLIIACAGVLSAYAYDNFIADNSEGVVYGDTVVIDYTGSLYGYYDAATDTVVPVIFDTTLQSVFDNKSNVFVCGFSKDSFSTTSITLGQGKFLKAFENAIIGHKVGDTVKVIIPAADAYPAPNSNVYKAMSELEFKNNFVISVDEYKTLFNKDVTPSEGSAELEDKNGLLARVVYGQSAVTVTYILEKDKAYTLVDNTVGKVTMTPTSECGADTIKYTLTIENQKAVKDSTISGYNASAGEYTSVAEIEMISYDLFGQSYNLVGYDSTGFVYNTATSSSDAIHNMDLYFVIKIVSKS